MHALLPPRDLDAFREALDGYTPDRVQRLLGPVGQSAHARGDLNGVERALEGEQSKLATLVRLFLLGLPVSRRRAAAALAPLAVPTATPLLEDVGDRVRARVEVRPYTVAEPAADTWWVVSDFGADARPGTLPREHVLGIGAASVTLAQATVRQPVRNALDLGTGCGVQALHLGEHAARVVATDTNARALQLAATTAALSGQRWDLRRGSLLEPVTGELFDQIVANPPFVVSPGGGDRLEYRDGGSAGDAISRALITQLPDRLAPGGVAQLLANWEIRADAGWDERLAGWLAGRGVDAWVWQREVAEPGEYVTLWLRDAGEHPGTDRWREQYTRWLDWFASAGVVAVGMGMVSLWRTEAADPVVVCEDVRQAVEQPIWPAVAAWPERRRWLASCSDEDLLRSRLRSASGLVRRRDEACTAGGWRPVDGTVRQTHGMRWELEVDDAVAGVIGACDGRVPLSVPVGVLAGALSRSSAAVADALLPVIRDLVGRGFLEPCR
jgi:methylase of polypeptide subunit release factors